MKIQKFGNDTLRLTFCATALIYGSFPAAQAVENEENQNRVVKNETSTSSASISGNVKNGIGVVTYNDQEVWSGEIKKGLRTAARSGGGKGEGTDGFAAAWDGVDLVWENVAGAGKELQGMAKMGMDGRRGKEMQERLEEMMKRAGIDRKGVKAASSINGSTKNGVGVVTYGGEEVWTGKVNDSLRVKAEASRDKDKFDGEYAAAWDGKKVLWENVEGAAEELNGK